MKKILNKLLILTTLLLLVMPVWATDKRFITPVLYHNTGGTLEYRLNEENSSSSKITDGSMSDGKKTHLYAYGQTYCAPWVENGENCEYDYENQWSHLVWSSQGVHYGSTESDYTLANEGMTMLTDAYNSVINFYTTWGKEWVPYASSTAKGSIGDLYSLFVNKSISFDGGWTISLQLDPTLSETEQKSMEKAVQKTSFSMEDVKFARISVSGPSNYSTLLKGYETTKVVVWAVNKPIMPGKKAWLTLEQLCQYATSAAETTGGDRYLPGMFSDTGAFEQFQSVSATEEAVNGIFGTITTGITNFVGFEDPEVLIFESGTDSYSNNRYLGMMPQTWWNASNTMFWFFEVIAILVLFASVINSAIKQSMASISPSIRNTLKDSIANLGIAIVLLILYAPMFYVLAKVNSMIVTALSSFANEMGATLSATNASFGTGWNAMVQFILSLVLFFINAGLIIKINLDYFIRSITIMILHSMAPVAIASISFDNRKTLFNSWLKELIGNIFMQSFNALVLAMIMIVLKGGAVHWWYYQASLFAISSLNSWFMRLFGLQNSVSEIAGNVHSQSKEAFNEAKKNVGAAVGVASSVASIGNKISTNWASGGGSAPGGVTSNNSGNGGGGSTDPGKGGNVGASVAKNNDNKTRDAGPFSVKTNPSGPGIKVESNKETSSKNKTAEQISTPEAPVENPASDNVETKEQNNGGSSSFSNNVTRKDDTINQKGNDGSMSRAKYNAKVLTAAVASEFLDGRSYFGRKANEYLGVNKQRDNEYPYSKTTAEKDRSNSGFKTKKQVKEEKQKNFSSQSTPPLVEQNKHNYEEEQIRQAEEQKKLEEEYYEEFEQQENNT